MHLVGGRSTQSLGYPAYEAGGLGFESWNGHLFVCYSQFLVPELLIFSMYLCIDMSLLCLSSSTHITTLIELTMSICVRYLFKNKNNLRQVLRLRIKTP